MDVAVVKVLVEHYGWPLVTVTALIVILWRVMVKHEGQMSRIVEQQTQAAAQQSVVTEINESILEGLKAVAAQMSLHDKDEDRRHRDTQDRIDRRGR